MFSLIDFNVAAIFFNERDDKKKKTFNLSIQNIDLDERVIKDIKDDIFSSIFGDEYFKEENQYDYEIVEINNGKDKPVESLTY